MTTADDALVSRLQEIIDSDSRAVLWVGEARQERPPATLEDFAS